MRFNIARHFSHKHRVLSFVATPLLDVFEIQVPRLRISHAVLQNIHHHHHSDTLDAWEQEERDKLRLEITLWWKGVKEHLGQIQEYLEEVEGTPGRRKPLPPSPSVEDDAVTPKPSQKQLPAMDSSSVTSNSTIKAAPSISSVSTTGSSVELLHNLRQVFQATEQALYYNLNKNPPPPINDVRRLFQTTAKAAENRLSAWQAKHATETKKIIGHANYPEPEWWSPDTHALPGGSILVREGEWASVIAFTLSSPDYLRELNGGSRRRIASSTGATVAPTTSSLVSSASSLHTESLENSDSHSTSSSMAPSLTSLMANVQALTSRRATPSLDPDDDALADKWHSQETWSSQVTRRDHPKDGSTIVALRDALRNVAENSSSPSRLIGLVNTSSKINRANPPSAFVKPSVEVDSQTVQGSVVLQAPVAVTVFEQILHDTEQILKDGDYTMVETVKASDHKAIDSHKQQITESITQTDDTPKGSRIPPPVPPKEGNNPSRSRTPVPGDKTPTPDQVAEKLSKASAQLEQSKLELANSTESSAVGSLTSTIANAMRYVLTVGQGETISRPPSPSGHHHGLLAADNVNEQPHIRYEWIIGNRLQFSCTVYYAKQFDSLRRKCGVDEALIHSLTRSENWAAEGAFQRVFSS